MEKVNIVNGRKQLAEYINRVAYSGERILLQRRGKTVAALVPYQDAEYMERLEDEYWTKEALKAEAEAKEKGEEPIPMEVVERELDELKARRARRTQKVKKRAA